MSVILTQTTPTRVSLVHISCTVYVTSRTGVGIIDFYVAVQKGNKASTVSITGECCTLLTTSPPPPPLSCKPSHCCYGQQDWF